jgi:aryl-alcohol dehydrogenase-like predicted oxidoreductase
MKRREFLEVVTAAASVPLAAGLCGSQSAAFGAEQPPTQAPPQDTVRGDMRYRKLGRTGEEVSLVGLGGYHIGIQQDENESIRIIRSAVDAGVNFLDNCWDYNNGASEERMGKALRDGYRQKVFLMSKIDGRANELAAKQIDESLRRLQTDRIDLMQHHEVIRLEDPDRIFATGGAQEAMLAAKQAGKVRYIGFTGHKDPVVHLRMLETAAKHGFHFDAAQMPLNVLDAHFRSFGQKVVPELVKAGIGVLGMKPLASGAIVRGQFATATECLHYAMSLPTSTVITGIDRMDLLRQALDAVKTFRPLTAEQMTALLQRTARAAADGQHEQFKTGAQFDATARHPEWIG